MKFSRHGEEEVTWRNQKNPLFFTVLRVLQVVHISERHNMKEEVMDGGIRKIPCFFFPSSLTCNVFTFWEVLMGPPS
jgi:hypothetical protein